MTDRELLEKAAKAAGIRLHVWGTPGQENFAEIIDDGMGSVRWNPITDDGDALRLAVKLRLNVTFTAGLGKSHGEEFFQVVPRTMGHLAEFGPIVGENYSLIRRAIVRAAAALAP